jgi:hypothetical protein
VGDVVGTEVSLRLDALDLVVDDLRPQLEGFTISGFYDGQALELLDQVRYSELFDSLTFLTYFFSFDGSATPEKGPTLGVFQLAGNFKFDKIESFLGSGEPFPLMTVYFRVRGQPGQTTAVEFLDHILAGTGCNSNMLLYGGTDNTGHSRFFDTLSTQHLPGSIRILPGEPTRPDPPAIPENAKIYDEAPTAETASIHLELVGPSVTHPGATDATFEAFITSNFEFSGFMTAVRFPAEHMTLTRVDEATRPGIVLIDNEGGGFGILHSSGRRRVGREGERVHTATLHFDVKESAADVSRLQLRFEPFDNYYNWLAIHHRAGLQTDALPITAEVGPLFVPAALMGVQTRPTRLGDVNLDYALDISDPVTLLGRLFLGEPGVFCAGAADWSSDGRLDISDPIGILNHLFLGAAPKEREVGCE